MNISEINIYPIKALKGIGLMSAVVERRGFEFDRRWVMVDKEGKFLTQRELPQMATIRVVVQGDSLEVTANGSGTLRVEPLFEGPRVTTQVWASTGEAIAYDLETNEWFSDVLGTEVQLRYMPDDAGRPVNPLFDAGSDKVSFADAYPLLLANEASMADLNSRMETALPINRFRPNLVVSGAEPWAEDGWSRIKVGEAIFRVVKPSDRCVVTTIDQARGESGGKEPLKTLATFRMSKDVFPDTFEAFGLAPNSVLFAENLIPVTTGVRITVGDTVEVIEKRN